MKKWMIVLGASIGGILVLSLAWPCYQFIANPEQQALSIWGVTVPDRFTEQLLAEADNACPRQMDEGERLSYLPLRLVLSEKDKQKLMYEAGSKARIVQMQVADKQYAVRLDLNHPQKDELQIEMSKGENFSGLTKFKLAQLTLEKADKVLLEFLEKHLLGIKTHNQFVRLFINNQYQGIYWLSEKLGKELLERNGLSSQVLIDHKKLNQPLSEEFSGDLSSLDLTKEAVRQTQLIMEQINQNEEQAIARINLAQVAQTYALAKLLGQTLNENNCQLSYDFSSGQIQIYLTKWKTASVAGSLASKDLVQKLIQHLLAFGALKKPAQELVQQWRQAQWLEQNKEQLSQKMPQMVRAVRLPARRRLSVEVAQGQARLEQNLRDLESELVAMPDRPQQKPVLEASWMEPYPFLKANKHNNQIEWISGEYRLEHNLIIPAGYLIDIAPGTKILLGENVSVLSYSPMHIVGSESKPIIIRAIDEQKPFATFAMVHTGEAINQLKYLDFSGGKEGYLNGIRFLGALCVYRGSAEIDQIKVHHNHADDGLNIKNGVVQIKNSQFFGNFADQVDLDFCEGEVSGNEFVSGREDANGDGLDVSGAAITIKHNVFREFQDKGISVGEHSYLLIYQNQFKNNNWGIAIKDLSVALVAENIFIQNQVAVKAYNKKPLFGQGGTGILYNNQSQENKDFWSADKASRQVAWEQLKTGFTDFESWTAQTIREILVPQK